MRKREEIEASARDSRTQTPAYADTIMLIEVLEVLLDIRELLKELNGHDN